MSAPGTGAGTTRRCSVVELRRNGWRYDGHTYFQCLLFPLVYMSRRFGAGTACHRAPARAAARSHARVGQPARSGGVEPLQRAVWLVDRRVGDSRMTPGTAVAAATIELVVLDHDDRAGRRPGRVRRRHVPRRLGMAREGRTAARLRHRNQARHLGGSRGRRGAVAGVEAWCRVNSSGAAHAARSGGGDCRRGSRAVPPDGQEPGRGRTVSRPRRRPCRDGHPRRDGRGARVRRAPGLVPASIASTSG